MYARVHIIDILPGVIPISAYIVVNQLDKCGLNLAYSLVVAVIFETHNVYGLVFFTINLINEKAHNQSPLIIATYKYKSMTNLILSYYDEKKSVCAHCLQLIISI